MYLDCPDRWAELVRRATLPTGRAAALRMLRRAARNDLRGIAEPGPRHRRTLAALDALPAEPPDGSPDAGLSAAGADPAALAALADRLRRAGPDAHWETLRDVAEAALAGSDPDPWLRVTVLNAVLVRAGHVPVAGYAFGRWRLPADRPPTRDELFALVELATCYLFRLVPTPADPPGRRERQAGRGAYSVIYRRGGLAAKVGRNLAARAFALRQEALMLRDVAATPAGRHVPALHGYDADRGVLWRDFVTGRTGHELLVSGEFQADRRLRDALRGVYHDLVGWLSGSRRRLDLHPGNFVWDASGRRWVFVDLGPVPQIGFDYYDLSSYDRYLRDTWLRRLERIRTEPIRSLLL